MVIIFLKRPSMLTDLIELRRRLLSVLMVFILAFLVCFMNAKPLFHWVIQPFLSTLPVSSEMIAIHITSPLLTPIKLALNTALFITAPMLLFQIWRFAYPGLYRSERFYLLLLTAGSLCLFALGSLFCFYIVLPLMLQFFVAAIPEGVRLLPEISVAVDFITRMILLFGFAFQIPLLCFFLVRTEVVDTETLKKIRPYVIVSAFTLGMLLTPPDVLSQILLAIPLCLLYESGILLTALVNRGAKKQPV